KAIKFGGSKRFRTVSRIPFVKQQSLEEERYMKRGRKLLLHSILKMVAVGSLTFTSLFGISPDISKAASPKITAPFGSPVIDGKIDAVWNKAQAVTPKHRTGNTDMSATFKALWDDNALYILAEVKDKNFSMQSG